MPKTFVLHHDAYIVGWENEPVISLADRDGVHRDVTPDNPWAASLIWSLANRIVEGESLLHRAKDVIDELLARRLDPPAAREIAKEANEFIAVEEIFAGEPGRYAVPMTHEEMETLEALRRGESIAVPLSGFAAMQYDDDGWSLWSPLVTSDGYCVHRFNHKTLETQRWATPSKGPDAPPVYWAEREQAWEAAKSLNGDCTHG
jgi:hypothetical protein